MSSHIEIAVTWAMMIVAFGLAGTAVRWRRSMPDTDA